MEKQKIYPVASSDTGMLFYIATPSKGDAADGFDAIVVESCCPAMKCSFASYVTRPHDMIPLKNSRMARFCFDFSNPDWGKAFVENDRKIIARYATEAPKGIDIPDSYSIDAEKSLRSLGVEINGPRRVKRISTPTDDGVVA